MTHAGGNLCWCRVSWLVSLPTGCVRSVDAAANSQGALKLTTAALSKYRGDQLLRALKAHALERSGKLQEALTVRPPPARP